MEIRDYRALERAVRDLQRDLDRQRIVWLAGRHDPAQITLAPDAEVSWLARQGRAMPPRRR